MLTELLDEATRQLTICNACRYCEGYCAVYPALEIRRELGRGDVVYLANLCHDCRACFYACMYTPPHEFAINIPLVLSSVREETYAGYGWPQLMARLMSRGALGTVIASIVAALLAAAAITLFASGHRLFGVVAGPESFYKLVPYLVLVIGFLGLGAYALAAVVAGGVTFWRDTRGRVRDMLSWPALRAAGADSLRLRYLRGGGDGCYYPADSPSMARRSMHSLVFYGFLLDFAATISAAVAQDILGIPPPYPLLSVPVVLGIVGGVMMVVGTTALIRIKQTSDVRPSALMMITKDYGFLISLDLVAITGLLLLALRASPLLGTALAVHLGALVVFFLTIPYGKFVHFAYRYLALVQNRIESVRSE
ncbi:MAG: tricarballylate utilization 4Fe-4S protein TcuB [Candidatus Dormibacteria bacterium]